MVNYKTNSFIGKNSIELRDNNKDNIDNSKQINLNIKSKPTDQNTINQIELSNDSLKNNILLIVKFMRELVQRSKLIVSFYEENITSEPLPYEMEVSFLLNKICYETKTFITTFSSPKENKDTSSLVVLSKSNEKLRLTDELIRNLKSNSDYKEMRATIVQNYLLMSNQISKEADFYNKIDENFKNTLASNLMKFSIDIVEEAVVLDESEQKDLAVQKYTQAQFILDEILSKFNDYYNQQ